MRKICKYLLACEFLLYFRAKMTKQILLEFGYSIVGALIFFTGLLT